MPAKRGWTHGNNPHGVEEHEEEEKAGGTMSLPGGHTGTIMPVPCDTITNGVTNTNARTMGA